MSNCDDKSTERKRNLWAPWRTDYITSLGDKEAGGDVDGCFLCRYRDQADRDKPNYVLWRGRHGFAMLNRYPYTGGHSMVAPYNHVGEMDGLGRDEMLELLEMVRDLQPALREALRCEGFNVGINVGRCAGAGLPGHLHIHVVPRWSGDTNFLPVFGEVRVIPQSLDDIYGMLKSASDKLGLPKLES
jgi:ATP adenylyltransferase